MADELMRQTRVGIRAAEIARQQSILPMLRFIAGTLRQAFAQRFDDFANAERDGVWHDWLEAQAELLWHFAGAWPHQSDEAKLRDWSNATKLLAFLIADRVLDPADKSGNSTCPLASVIAPHAKYLSELSVHDFVCIKAHLRSEVEIGEGGATDEIRNYYWALHWLDGIFTSWLTRKCSCHEDCPMATIAEALLNETVTNQSSESFGHSAASADRSKQTLDVLVSNYASWQSDVRTQRDQAKPLESVYGSPHEVSVLQLMTICNSLRRSVALPTNVAR